MSLIRNIKRVNISHRCSQDFSCGGSLTGVVIRLEVSLETFVTLSHSLMLPAILTTFFWSSSFPYLTNGTNLPLNSAPPHQKISSRPGVHLQPLATPLNINSSKRRGHVRSVVCRTGLSASRSRLTLRGRFGCVAGSSCVTEIDLQSGSELTDLLLLYLRQP